MDPEALVGQRIGGCRLERLLGQGGMGIVFRAVQESLGRPVALKLIELGPLAEAGDEGERFFREGRAAARVNHANVVQVHDCGRDRGRAYIVMELIRGESLGALLDRVGALPADAALDVAAGAARGLGAAHREGLVHRDVKPDNILITEDGTPKLVDFGLIRDLDQPGLTRSGVILGTPRYMSPEQCEGQPADPRSDLYSLGVTLYRALAGRLPFDGTIAQLLLAHTTRTPPPLRVRDLPAALEALVMRLLAKRPEDRYADAAALLRDLDGVRADLGRLEGRRDRPGPAGRRAPGQAGAPPRDAEVTVDFGPDGEPATGHATGPGRAAGSRAAGAAPALSTPLAEADGGLATGRSGVATVAGASALLGAGAAERSRSHLDTVDLSVPAGGAASGAAGAASAPVPPAAPAAPAGAPPALGADGLIAADLVLRAKLHYVRGDLAAAETDFAEAARAAPGDGAPRFALACVRARLGRPEAALEALADAIERGFRDRQKLDAANDLAPLRQDPRFRALLRRVRGAG